MLFEESELSQDQATTPEEVKSEYDLFLEWWPKYAETLNQRAILVWQEIAWSAWFARSELCDGKEPSIFPRKE